MPAVALHLRPVADEDLPIFFEQQLDAESNYLAAFTVKDPTDRAAFMARWARLRSDGTVCTRAIVVHQVLVGYVASFEQAGEAEVTFWLGKAHRGHGFATQALTLLLKDITKRPLFAHAAKDNAASVRVLWKCGFQMIGEGEWFSNVRSVMVPEIIFRLDG